MPENFKREEIVFKILEDVEHLNRGFEVDMITAHWFGYPLGYHSIMYYRKENIEAFCPDVETYAKEFLGRRLTIDCLHRVEKTYKGLFTCRLEYNFLYISIIF